MKFIKLSIENYKSFQFATEILFPMGADGRSIFLIGGMNGAGKTSVWGQSRRHLSQHQPPREGQGQCECGV